MASLAWNNALDHWTNWISDGAFARLGRAGRETTETLFSLCPLRGIELIGKTGREKFQALVGNGQRVQLIRPEEANTLLAVLEHRS